MNSPSSVVVARCALLLAAILLACFAWQSDGVDENDDLLHYLNARTAWTDPRYLLEIWGRPGLTIPAAAVANIGTMPAGFTACALLCVAMYLATAWLVFATARRLRLRYGGAATIAFLLMPVPFALSIMPKTEVAAALYIALATWLFAGGRRRAAAVVLALLPVTRHELLVLLVPVGCYFLLRRDVIAALLLGWAELGWNLACYAAGMPWPLSRFVSKGGPGGLGSGGWLHFANHALEVAGVGGAGLALAGMAMLAVGGLRRARRWRAAPPAARGLAGRSASIQQARESDAYGRDVRHLLISAWRLLMRPGRAGRRVRVLLLVSCGAMIIIVLQTVLFTFNRFASGGYARFLIPAAPWLAICMTVGVAPILDAARRRDDDAEPRTIDRRVGRAWPLLLAGGVLLASTDSPAYIFFLPGPLRIAAGAVLLAFALRPHRHFAWAALILLGVLAMWQWLAIIGPQRIEPHEVCMRDGVARLVAEYPDHQIVGPNPWVTYLQGRPIDTSGPHDPFAYWQRSTFAEGGGPPRLIYVLDATSASWIAGPEDVEAYPCRLLFTLKQSPDEREPFLRAYLRLPGGRRAATTAPAR